MMQDVDISQPRKSTGMISVPQRISSLNLFQLFVQVCFDEVVQREI